MFNGIGWISYIKTIAVILLGYYLVIGWIYRKDLLQWLRDRKNK